MSDTATNAVVPTTPVEDTKTTTTVTSEAKPSGSGMKIALIVGVIVVCLCTICSIAGWFIYQSTLNASKGILDTISNQVQDEIDNIEFNVTDEDNSDTDVVDNSDDADMGDDVWTDGDYSFDGTLHSSFPSDVPIPNGVKIGFSGSSKDADGKPYVSATMTSSASEEELADFYRNNLKSQGWSITSEQSFFGTSFVAEKQGREVSILLFGDETSDTSVTIGVTGD